MHSRSLYLLPSLQEENVRRKQVELKRKAEEAAAAQGGGKRPKGWWEAREEGGEGQAEDDDVEWYRQEVGCGPAAWLMRLGGWALWVFDGVTRRGRPERG
jgi:hypothetical protein